MTTKNLLRCLLLFTGFQLSLSTGNITNFIIQPGGTNLIKLTNVDQVVHLQYDTGHSPSLSAFVNSNPLPASDVNLATETRTATVTIRPAVLVNNLGIHDLTITLGNNFGSETLNLFILYEVEITGLASPGQKHYCNIDEFYLWDFDLVSGSNVLGEWMLLPIYNTVAAELSILQVYSGDVTKIQRNHSCDAIGVTNVTLVAANNASSQYTWFEMTVQYPINNITFLAEPLVQETSTEIKFKAEVSSNALIPMGTLNGMIMYHTGINESKPFHVSSGEHAVEYSTNFTTQGYFNASITIWSESNKAVYTTSFGIWDTLQVTIEPTKTAVEVGELVTFNFYSTPPSGFQYVISYGNGQGDSNGPADLYNPFVHPTLTTTYLNPIIYQFTSTSFNPEYTANHTNSITVQYPVKNISMTPESLIIPYLNATIIFTLAMDFDMPSPTNASCTFDYGDGNSESIPMVISFSSPLVCQHDYAGPGNFTVQVTCINLISSLILPAYVGVRTYTIDDIILLHQNPFPTNYSEGRTVEFRIQIKDLQVVPPYTSLKWNFGDGTLENNTLTDWIKTHYFPQRSKYSGQLHITMDDTTRNIPFEQEIGTVEISTTSRIVLAGDPVPFIVTNKETGHISDPLKFDINFVDNSPHSALKHVNHSFENGGYYVPIVKSYNSTFVEYNTLQTVVIVENPLTTLVEMHPPRVPFPPGIMTLSLGLPAGAKPITFVNCLYYFGDISDPTEYHRVDNISDSHPISYTYTYVTLGTQTINYYCSNVLTSANGTMNIEVMNDCFSFNGMFDRQYTVVNNPMRIYTSKYMKITSRLTIFCGEDGPQFKWKMLNLTEASNKTKVVNINQPDTDFILFSKNAIPKGLYSVSLNISFLRKLDSWLSETTFLEFRDPPIRAELFGGKQRSSGMVDIYIDAETLSYDPIMNQGDPDTLDFAWECRVFNSTNVEDLIQNSNTSIKVDCESICEFESPGNLLFKGSRLTYPVGYVFTVSVSKPGRINGVFTQFLQMLYGAPDINIVCKINCEIKVALSVELSLETECSQCFDFEYAIAVYNWNMVRLLDKQSNITQVEDLSSKLENTGANPSAIVLKDNVLEPGAHYLITVNVTIPGRLSSGYAAYSVDANLPPYNGSCFVTPTEGIASKTKFKITCDNFMDEGFRPERNIYEDSTEPLLYLFVIIKGNTTIPLDDGVESTSPNLELPTVPGALGSDYQLVAYVYDILQDYTAITMNIKLSIPLNSTDSQSAVAQVDTLLSESSELLKDTGLSGSTVRFTRAVNSVMSVIQSVKLPDNNLLFDASDDIVYNENYTAPDWKTVYYDYLRPKDTHAEEEIQRIGQDQMTALSNRSVDALSGGGVTQLSETVANILRNPKSSTMESAVMGSKLAVSTASRLNIIAKQRPYPISDQLNIGIKGMASMLGGIMNKAVPNLKGRVPVLDRDAILAEVQASEKGGPGISREEAAHLAYKIAESEEAEVERQKTTSRGIIHDLEESLDQSQDALTSLLVPGQAARTVQNEQLLMSARKLNADYLAAANVTAGEFTVNLPSANRSGILASESVDVQTTVFKKNPYTWGKNDSSYDIESPVIKMKIKVQNGTTVKIPLTLKIKVANPPSFANFSMDETVKGDEGMHYHTFPLRKVTDVCIVYIDLSNITTNVQNVTAYMRMNKTPKVNKYEYKTDAEQIVIRGQNVFKITAPPDSFPTIGTVIIGLVFIEGDPLSDSQVAGQVRKRRSIASNSTASNSTASMDNSTTTQAPASGGPRFSSYSEPPEIKYGVLATTDGCRVWDEEQEAWDPRACRVSAYSTPDETICICDDPPGNSFASAFYVPPNTIDFSVIWTKFDISNAAVYGTLIGLLILYAFIILWARRKDEKDLEKWCVGYLRDNMSDDRHYYLITVHTGLRKNAGTKSNIFFILAGEHGDTAVRCLTDGKREFETGSVINLVCSTFMDLGDLSFIRLWHDNKGFGGSASWFLNKIIVQDLQSHQRYVFLSDRWLAIDKDDGLIDRLVPVAVKDDLMTFDKLFSAHARVNVTDAHLWLSVFIRPDKSTFSRVQRVSCCLALIFLTMIVSAMFFESENEATDEETVRSDFQIGPLRFSMSTLFTSVVSVCITLPPSLFLVYLFKNSKPSKDYFKIRQKSGCICCRKAKNTQPTIVVTDGPEGDDILNNKEDEKRLPHWCIHIAWALVVIIVLVCAFFLILYSMEWGKAISEEWLASFFLSFFENLFVLDPVKVLAISFLLAFLLRSPYNESEKVDVAKVQTEVKKYGLRQIDLSQLPPDPVPDSLIQKARERRTQEQKAKLVFLDLIMYSVFLFALYAVCYGNRAANNYNYQSHVQHVIYEDSFENIKTYDDFFQWINDTMIPALFPVSDYRGGELDWRGRLYFQDNINFRVGPARIRQVRINERPPPYYGKKYKSLVNGYTYYWPYKNTESHEGDYCPGWTTQPCSLDMRLTSSTLDAWVHTSSDEAWGMPVSGNLDIYDGDGYFFQMSINRDVSVSMLEEVKKFSWLDRQTRAVVVEFSLYNANNNLLTMVQLIAEFPAFGGVLTWKHITTLRVFQNVGPIGAFIVICEILVVIILMVFGYRTLKILFKERFSFFTSFWNIVNLINFIITLFAIVFFICREVYSSLTLEKFRADPKKYVNFEHIVLWDELFVYTLSFLVFTGTIGMLRILGYNRKFTMIGEVLRSAAKSLIGLGCVFGIFYCAYIGSGYILFHTQINEFRSHFDTGVTIFTYLLGKNQLGQKLGASTGLGALYFFTLVFFIILILLTMFQAVMNNTMTVVRSDVSSIPPPYGIGNVLTNIYKGFVVDWIPAGFFKKQVQHQQEEQVINDLEMKRRRTQVHNILESFKEQFEKSLDLKRAPMRDKASYFNFGAAAIGDALPSRMSGSGSGSTSRSTTFLPITPHHLPYHFTFDDKDDDDDDDNNNVFR